MSNAYQVPTQILTSQAKITGGLYREDSEENRQLLAGIGVTEDVIREMTVLAAELDEVEASQEEVKNDALTEQTEATEAVRAIISWRKDKVLPRAKIALKGDRRLRHFRTGKLQSYRTATVIREGKLLAAAIERFADLPELQKRGVTKALAEEGQALIASAETEDIEAAAAMAHQKDVTEQVYELEDKLDDLLAEVERCAAAVFPADSAALKRYRLNEIRNYVAQMHQKSPVDPTAEIEVPDPVPGA